MIQQQKKKKKSYENIYVFLAGNLQNRYKSRERRKKFFQATIGLAILLPTGVVFVDFAGKGFLRAEWGKKKTIIIIKIS